MPKLIVGAKDTILETARGQLMQGGYRKLTVRGVAKGCGIAVGTLYNYFPSKDMLVAGVMMEDWLVAMEGMRRGCEGAPTIRQGVLAMCGAIDGFAALYRPMWAEYDGELTALDGFASRHSMLRSQLEGHLTGLLARLGRAEDMGLVPLLAEMVLAVAVQPDVDQTAFEIMLGRIFKEEE